MAHSLEARVPFLDPVVAELALALETKQKVRGFSKKRLLRRAVEPLLPKEIVRGRKQGFSIPVAAWLRGDLGPFARDVLSAETIERQGYLDPAAVTKVLDDHVSGREDLSRQIWDCSTSPSGTTATPASRRGPRRRRLMPDTIDALLRLHLRRGGRLDAGAGDRVARPEHRGPLRSTSRTSAACTSSRRRKLGGLAVLVAVLIGGSIFLPWDQETRSILAGAIVITAVGVIDDLVDLPCRRQAARPDRCRDHPGRVRRFGRHLHRCRSSAAVDPSTVQLFDPPGIGAIDLARCLTVFGIVAVANVINLIDGVDGLAAGSV